MRFTDEQVSAMLTDYVEGGLSANAFAKRNGLTLAAAKCLLKGTTYAQATRPPGFAYPWPKVRQLQLKQRWYWSSDPAKRTEQRAELLRIYVARRMTAAQFASRARISRDTARLVLNGHAWPEVERPEGFMYPWSENTVRTNKRKHTAEAVEEALRLHFIYGWSNRQLAAHLGIGVNSARNIIIGATYKEAGRP